MNPFMKMTDSEVVTYASDLRHTRLTLKQKQKKQMKFSNSLIFRNEKIKEL